MLMNPLANFTPAGLKRIQTIIDDFNKRFAEQTGVTPTLPVLPIEELKVPNMADLKLKVKEQSE